MSEPESPVPLTAIVRVPRVPPSEIPEMVLLVRAPLGMFVNEAPEPLKIPAVIVFVLLSNVRPDEVAEVVIVPLTRVV